MKLGTYEFKVPGPYAVTWNILVFVIQ
jgi:hypothetical protein